MRSELLGTVALSLALAAAVVLTNTRPAWRPNPSLFRLVWVSIAVQSAHAVEEWITGFHVRFPQILGLAEWSPGFFATFNLVWIAVWIGSLAALNRGTRAAVTPIWFLALAMTGNGIAHLLLALAAAGYFPGLYTSPVVGIVGFVLLRKLLEATAPAESPRRSAH